MSTQRQIFQEPLTVKLGERIHVVADKHEVVAVTIKDDPNQFTVPGSDSACPAETHIKVAGFEHIGENLYKFSKNKLLKAEITQYGEIWIKGTSKAGYVYDLGPIKADTFQRVFTVFCEMLMKVDSIVQ